MTPQSLSIADLKAVIDYIEKTTVIHEWDSDEINESYDLCNEEIIKRISAIHPPTEPKTEESK